MVLALLSFTIHRIILYSEMCNLVMAVLSVMYIMCMINGSLEPTK